MKDIRIWFIFIFAGMSASSFIISTIKNEKRFITYCVLFACFTFVLLFSDAVAQFMVKVPGVEMAAKISQIENKQMRYDTSQARIVSDQYQLKESLNRILKIIDLKSSTPHALIFNDEKELKNGTKLKNDSIVQQKKELDSILHYKNF